MTSYKFYAGFGEGVTVKEIQNMETDEYTISVPVFPDGNANNDTSKEIEVVVVSPVGYTLTDRDFAQIDELLADER